MPTNYIVWQIGLIPNFGQGERDRDWEATGERKRCVGEKWIIKKLKQKKIIAFRPYTPKLEILRTLTTIAILVSPKYKNGSTTVKV